MAAILARPADGEEVRVTETGNSSMKVVVRVRPESEAELRSSCHCVVKVVDEHVLTFDPAEHQGEGKEHDRGGEEGRDERKKGWGRQLVCLSDFNTFMW